MSRQEQAQSAPAHPQLADLSASQSSARSFRLAPLDPYSFEPHEPNEPYGRCESVGDLRVKNTLRQNPYAVHAYIQNLCGSGMVDAVHREIDAVQTESYAVQSFGEGRQPSRTFLRNPGYLRFSPCGR